jgi:Tol biopolymer transport system component
MQHTCVPKRGAAIIIAALTTGLIALGAAEAASWSPDGKSLAYSYIGGPENIYIVNADGSSVRSIVVREQRDFRPEWSPDGAHLVFTTVIDGVHAVMRVDVDGGNLQQTSPLEEAAGDPDYSPDGRRLLYFTDEPRPRDLFVRDVASGKVAALTDTPDFEEVSPRWHPDGRQVVFVGKETGENVESDIWVLDTETGESRNLTGTANIGEFHPDWSHDGSRVVYIRVENGNFDVAIRHVSSGQEIVVASGNDFAVLDPHFSPNDSEITFTRTDFAEKGEGMPAIVAVSLEGDTERTIAKGLYLSQIASMEMSVSDARDGNTYGTVDIAGMRWMTENLRYAVDGSVCFDNLPENCDRYGRLYSWEVALQACPDGWHLSTEFEWQYRSKNSIPPGSVANLPAMQSKLPASIR